jgi:hypothetical protein
MSAVVDDAPMMAAVMAMPAMTNSRIENQMPAIVPSIETKKRLSISV